MKWWFLLLLPVSAAIAQQIPLEDSKRAALNDCGSVVIVKCDRPAARAASGADQTRQQSATEQRRQSPLTQRLDGVVIEGEALRRRSIEEMMNLGLPAVRPRDGTHTFETGEGTKCSCLNVCPPWPLPCCTCSGRMGRYGDPPGSSPLN